MKELLALIRQGTFDACRDDVSRHEARLQAHPEPWNALRTVIHSDESTQPPPDAATHEKVGSFLLRTTASRLLDSLAVAGQQRDVAALRVVMKKRLDECRLACALLEGGFGSAGASWDSLNKKYPASENNGSDVRIGTLTLSPGDLRGTAPDLDWDFAIPAILSFGQAKGVSVLAPAGLRDKAIGAMESVALRLLMGAAPGTRRLVFLDPTGSYVGLGRAVPGASNVASTDSQIDSVLTEMLDGAGRSATLGAGTEPAWVIVGLDCAQLSPRSQQKLQSAVRLGGGCGSLALLHWTDRGSEHERQRIVDLSSAGSLIAWDGEKGAFVWHEEGLDDGLLSLDARPSDDIVRAVLQPVADAVEERRARSHETREAQRNPLLTLGGILEQCNLSDEKNWWAGDSTTEFEGALGLAIEGHEIGDPVLCRFGRGAEHALLAGVTGSGKNNLLNVLITSLAIRYSPEELEFFMIDLKEGVEFQRFAKSGLPHARVISVSNDAEFALNVLRGIEAEMENRGRLFVSAGATNIADYRQKTGKTLSRVLLVVDEAKTLYGGEDSSYALSFFDRMAAKGRSFGLHMLLANQGFSGASLKLSTIANMGIRLVTKGKGERAAENVLESSNSVLSSLRQHEAVYNDGQGATEHNHPCRVPQWTDSDDDFLRRLAGKVSPEFRKPVIFEGHVRPLLSSCSALSEPGIPPATDPTPRMWLGAPMSLEESVCVEWKRESKQNFLIVDTDEEEATALTAATWLSLLETVPPQAGQFLVLDMGTPKKAWSEILGSIRTASGARVVGIQDTVLDDLSSLAAIVETRTAARIYDEPALFLILNGVHRLRELRGGPAASASRSGSSGQRTFNEVLGAILRDGPYVGVHVIAWCDTGENVRRLLDSGKLRGEFGMVAAGRQPEDTLSRSLVGTGKAATVGPNRMVFANSGGDAPPCVFRPYGLTDVHWIEAVARRHVIDGQAGGTQANN